MQVDFPTSNSAQRRWSEVVLKSTNSSCDSVTVDVAAAVLERVRADDFAGYDPFDGLSSRVLQATPVYRVEWVRLVWLQLFKRSALNFRRLFGVPKKRNPKGIGLFISGLLEDYRRTGDRQYIDEARGLADWLLAQRSSTEDWHHCCWGYHFDWQARAFYVPAGKPNVITTVYVARALNSLGEEVGESRYLEAALDAAHFISRHLYTEVDGRRFYAYIPGDATFVHNASLWGAAWCAFAGRRLNDMALMEQALSVAQRSVSEQQPDGSWVYGARDHHQFIDGFHTGYNLEALCMIRDALGTTKFDDCIARGYRYYIETFFEPDGTAKYYANGIYPIDMHSFAQAVFTFLRVGGRPEDLALCDKVVRQGVMLLYMPDKGYFMYQKTRWLTNRINYVRWTQAWAYFSLAFYNRYRAEMGNAQD